MKGGRVASAGGFLAPVVKWRGGENNARGEGVSMGVSA